MGFPDLIAATQDLDAALAAAVGGDCSVVRDQAQIGPLVATDGVCVYIALIDSIVPATLDAYWITTPIHICVPSPFGPAQADRAYRVLARIVDLFDVIGYRAVDVDIGEIRFPSLTLDIRQRTTCIQGVS